MAKVGKKVFFNIPGFGRVESLPGAEFDSGGFKRDDAIADTGVAGYSEEPVAPNCSFELPMKAGLSVKKINDLTDVNVTITFDTGQVWIMENSWTAEPCKVKDGKIPVKMTGMRAEEVN